MKGTQYIIALVIYVASIMLPLWFCIQAVSYIHVALYAVFSLILLAGATIDMHYYILPDEGAVILAIGGCIYSYINDYSLVNVLTGVCVVGLITLLIRYISHKGFGLGDVKWFCAIATWLTPWELICFFYIAFCSGSLYLLLSGYKKRYIPFGPFLCFGGWCALHCGSYMQVLYRWILVSLKGQG